MKNRLQELNVKSTPIKEVCGLNTDLYNDAIKGNISWSDFNRLSKLCFKRYKELQNELWNIPQKYFDNPVYKVNKGY